MFFVGFISNTTVVFVVLHFKVSTQKVFDYLLCMYVYIYIYIFPTIKKLTDTQVSTERQKYRKQALV